MTKKEGFEPLSHSALVVHSILAGANQVADSFILRLGNYNRNQLASLIESRKQ